MDPAACGIYPKRCETEIALRLASILKKQEFLLAAQIHRADRDNIFERALLPARDNSRRRRTAIGTYWRNPE